MANRFETKKRIFEFSDGLYRIFSVLIFTAVMILFYLAASASGKSTIEKQQDFLESALSRDIVQCYAIEGMYPPSLEYLENHYGLTYDKDLFFVDYQPVASNLYPDVTVIKLNK